MIECLDHFDPSHVNMGHQYSEEDELHQLNETQIC